MPRDSTVLVGSRSLNASITLRQLGTCQQSNYSLEKHVNRDFLFQVRAALAALVLVALFGGSTARLVSAQDTGLIDDTTYVVELNDDEITWDNDWTFEEELYLAGDGYELIGLISDVGIQIVSYLPAGVNPEEARDVILGGLADGGMSIETVDDGSYGDVSYSLDLSDLDGEVWAIFTVVSASRGDVLTYLTYAPADNFGDVLDKAADDIEINGDAIYDGVEGDGLQDLIDVAAEDFEPNETIDDDADPRRSSDDEDAGDEDEEDNDRRSSRDDEEEEEDGNDSGSDVDADVDDYLSTVRSNYDDLASSVDRFNTLLQSGNLDEADIEEMVGILEIWMNAGAEAEALEAPEGFEDFHRIYEEYAWSLGEGGLAFLGFLSGEGDPDQYLAEFQTAMVNAEEYGLMLDELLSEVGY
jgi:hypothetical protein